jgi:hypothetical protein
VEQRQLSNGDAGTPAQCPNHLFHQASRLQRSQVVESLRNIRRRLQRQRPASHRITERDPGGAQERDASGEKRAPHEQRILRSGTPSGRGDRVSPSRHRSAEFLGNALFFPDS